VRFIKQEFCLEDVRVLQYRSIRRLVLLAIVVFGLGEVRMGEEEKSRVGVAVPKGWLRHWNGRWPSNGEYDFATIAYGKASPSFCRPRWPKRGLSEIVWVNFTELSLDF